MAGWAAMYNHRGVAETYDENRFWPYDDPVDRVSRLARALRVRENRTLLDVGCGTGYYLTGLMTETGCCGVGVDPSEAMVNVARRRAAGLDVRVGSAEQLPLSDGTVDAVLCHHAAHHFGDVPRFLREARRVLNAGGRIAVVTVSHEQMRAHPLYRFFPEILTLDCTRIPDTSQLRQWMEEAGFARVDVQGVDRSCVGLCWDTVLRFVERKFMSPMRLLPADEFERASRAFEHRVRASGLDECPAESYSVTSGTAE